ncbi:hypothetical protein EDC56_3093 [Sinobacterium caligoides]|uniref:YecA family protein n=1 Tax=Sinobacterium caligoides TaxID=933926 RepID=A0A3N2DGT3_9GAMM|nr:UPF0149 family protein [Sinobacterium caligoides]ROR98858.1 hypothetical protein EDC56_3093 [Sinobacterium caligoides]
MTTEYSDQSLNFDEVCDLLVELGSIISAAEFHGSVSGMLAGCIKDKKEPEGGWPTFMANTTDIDYQGSSLQQQELVEIGQQIADELTSESLSFRLLLPDDDDDISVRLESLGLWCQGFLTGLAQSGVTEAVLKAWPADSREALQDLAAISQIGSEGEEGATAEADYIDVSEYVRLAALHVFLECAGENNRGEQDMQAADRRADTDPAADSSVSVSELFARGTKRLH